jgi:catechol 2,3-dioxygenase-like lactoylglutathione lyase family enzyme
MANTLPVAGGDREHFSFTKLGVCDLEKTAAFYREVCGLVEWQRVQSEHSASSGGPMREISFYPTAAGGGSLTLIHYPDAPGPVHGELILGFTTPDLDAFLARAERAGGRIARTITEMPEHGVRVAFVLDPEGHKLEVVQLTRR